MSFSGQSNPPPWQRMQGQIGNNAGGLPFHQGVLHHQQGQQNLNFGHEQLQSGNIFQGGGSLISYPQSRSGLNPVAFSGGLQQQQGRSQQQQHYNSIGTVTKINNECGLVNEEVLFYRNVCKGHIPKLGDRVLFEASYSQNGQYKWNATRVQMMPQPGGINSAQPPPLMGSSNSNGSGYNAVPPPNEYQHLRRGRSSPSRDRHARSERDRERTHRSRDRDDDEHDRKRRREDRSRTSNVVSRNDRERDRDRDDARRQHDQSRERDREREREREREKGRERSPVHRSEAKTRRTRPIRRYMVQIPKTVLTFKRADIQELRQRYSTLYIPSDFFHANIKWSDSFTHDNPFSLSRPCQFHVMHSIVEPLNEIPKDIAEPPDANYKFSAKVMLMSCPPIAELYQKCFEDDENEQHTVHPSRLISFLVGTRGRNEPMAIGGAWSPSLDGENPDTDPSVLIRTAIRTCKSLTGIDLSNCTQWYRFVELYFHRNDHKNKDKDASPQIETVVIYLPDIHSCIPTISEWNNLKQGYKAAVENVISRKQSETSKVASGGDTTGSATLANDFNKETAAAGLADTSADTEAAKEDINTPDPDSTIITEDSKEDEEDDSPQPTHYSQLDLKAMKVQDIRNELIARNLPSKGVRNLIMARLAKALNTEKAEELNRSKNPTDLETIDCDSEEGIKNQNENDENSNLKNNIDDKEEEQHDEHEDWADVDMNDIVILDEYDSSKNPEDGLPKEFDDRKKMQLIRRYTLPNTPHVIVHPSKTAKGGVFDCSVMSLSVLLDYRPEDTKERFFEVSLFAELFNEMLMRDFGFNIYKELYLQKGTNTAELEATAEDTTTTNDKKDDTKSNDDEEKTKDSNDAVENKQDNAEKKKKDRRVSKQSADVDPEDDNQSVKSSADRKRKANTNDDKKMVVVKPHLLLSFVYFDTTHCGYIFEKDLEDLFSILGLSLSRGQIRKVLGKSDSRQPFYYRKLTDKEESIEAPPIVDESDDISMEDFRKIALGNKQYFPIFKTEASEEENIASGVTATQENNDLISYNGAVIHVGKLIEQIKRAEKNYSDLEKLYTDVCKLNTDMQKDHSKSSSKIKDLQSECKSLNRKLSDTDQDLYTINRKYKDQHATLSYIYHRVSPYFNREKDHKSENSRDKDHDKHKEKEKDSDKSKDNKEKDKSQVKEDEKERKNNDDEKKNETEKDKSETENDNEMGKGEEVDKNVKES